MIRKHISKPWLQYIISETKTFEGRVNKGFWKDLKIGDTFVLYDGTSEATVQVSSLTYFRDFGDAWFILQDKLIPNDICNIVTISDARKMYSQYFSQDDIKKYGVVAVGLNLIK